MKRGVDTQAVTRLSPTDKTLWRDVDEALHTLWDPLGVRDEALARGEYSSYTPRVFGLLRSTPDVDALTACLEKIARVEMGMDIDRAHHLRVARYLLTRKAAVLRETQA